MRIGIIRLTSLGDVVHTLPVAAAIRAQEPAARIVWIVEEREQVLLRDNPAVDEIVLAPLRRWSSALRRGQLAATLAAIHRFRRLVGALDLDVVLDVQGWTHKTSPIVRFTRAPRRIGFSGAYARQRSSTWFTTIQVTPPAEAVHIVDQNLALLGPLGIRVARAAFPLPRFPEADAAVARWRADQRIGEKPLIVLLPSTRGPRKLWPTPSYATLASRIARTVDDSIVLAGGPNERPLFEEIAATARVPGLLMYAPERIGDLHGLLRQARLVVGNDTGPLHLAAAAGVPAIGLFGPTRGDRNGPYGPRSSYIQSPSLQMSDIAVDQVLEAVQQRVGRLSETGREQAGSAAGDRHGDGALARAQWVRP